MKSSLATKNSENAELEGSTDFQRLVDLQSAHSDASNRLDALTAEADAGFLDIIDAAKTEYADLQQIISDAEAALESIARAHPEWFAKRKSVKTPYGTVKFQASTVLDVPNEEASIILVEVAAEKDPALADCVKTVKKLDLEALERLDDGLLKFFRIARVPKENFSVVPAKVDMGKAVKKAEGATESLAV